MTIADTNLIQDFELVLVSDIDVKRAHPEWTNQAVEDYQARFRNLVLTTERSDVDLDRIIVLEAEMDAVENRLDIVEAQLAYLEGLTVVTAIDYKIDNTVTGHQTIICTADVTVFLDATPNDRDTAEIKQTNTAITIDGNGKTIEGNATLKIRKRNTSLKTGLVMRYSAEADAWYVL